AQVLFLKVRQHQPLKRRRSIAIVLELFHSLRLTTARHSVGASSDEESRYDGGRTCFITLGVGSPMSRRACSADRERRVERRAADTGGQAASATLMAQCKNYCACKLICKILKLTCRCQSTIGLPPQPVRFAREPSMASHQ